MLKRILILAVLVLTLSSLSVQAASLRDARLPGELPSNWELSTTEDPSIFMIQLPDSPDVKATLTVERILRRSQFSNAALEQKLTEITMPMLQGRHLLEGDFFTQERSRFRHGRLDVFVKQARFQLSSATVPEEKLWGQVVVFYYNDRIYSATFTSATSHSEDYGHQLLTSLFGIESDRHFDYNSQGAELDF